MPDTTLHQAPQPPAGWNAYLQRFGYDGFHLRQEWSAVLRQALRHEPHFLWLTRGEAIVGVLPLQLVSGPIFGRYLVSQPYLNTGGVLAKLFSEAVESIDRGPVEGVRATGATPLQEVVWGVIPQVAPLWSSYALYRFESNSRSATVLGLIGAGGIGQTLFESLNSFAYAQVSAIAIVIVVAVTLIDLLSQTIRARLL